MNNIGSKEKQHIVSLHKKGYNLSEIMNETGLSWRTVKRWVTRYQQEGGLKTRPRSGRPRLLNETQQKEIFETYEEDGFIKTNNFAEKFDISVDTVRRSLRRLLTTSPAMSKSALVILAQGAEEMETVITVDMLRRGGVTVTVAGLDGSSPVLCSRQVTLVPDKSLTDALAEKPQYDAVILPGGLEGSDRLSKSSVVGTLLKEHEKSGKIIAAICAAPTAFVAHGVAKGKRVTSYPSTKEKIPAADYTYVEGERVVVDGNVVTSRGPGTAYWFGLKLIELLTGKEKADQVEKGMIISGY